MVLREDPVSYNFLLNRLNDSVGTFGMRFAPSKCITLQQHWTGPKANLVQTGEQVGEVNRFSYLGSCTSLGGRR